MKNTLLIIVLLCTTIAFSQEKTFEKEVSKISKKITLITQQEKDSLKEKVKAIDARVEKKELTKEEADTLKKEAAAYHAKNIEVRVGIQEQKLQQLVQDKINGKIASSENDYDDDNTFTIGNKTYQFKFNEKKREYREKRENRRKKKNRITTTQFVFAMGVNNVLIDNKFASLDNSEYKFWQSHFYEIGFTWKTRFTKKPSSLYLKYGVSFLWNNLRAENNKYHVVSGNSTALQTHPNTLSENRLRHVQMTFPVHFEFDFSKSKKYDDGFLRDRTHRSVRLGLGAFVGFKLGSRQYLEFTNGQGNKIEEIQKGGFNMNRVNYGLSAYLGYKSTSLYVKYDLNPLFKNTNTRNISLGLRFDLD